MVWFGMGLGRLVQERAGRVNDIQSASLAHGAGARQLPRQCLHRFRVWEREGCVFLLASVIA
jgi:hypothetical protein